MAKAMLLLLLVVFVVFQVQGAVLYDRLFDDEAIGTMLFYLFLITLVSITGQPVFALFV